MVIEGQAKYRHEKSGKEYIGVCHAQLKYGDEWESAFVYRDAGHNLYIRPIKQFEEKFVEVKDVDL